MRQRGRRGREGPGIDPGCKATAAGWRSVVWSHSYGSLQQTLQAISKTSLTPCNTPMKKGSRLKTRPSQDGLKNVYSLILFFMSDTEGPAVPLPYAMKNTDLFFLTLFRVFTLSTLDARLAVISPLETVQIVPGGAQSSIKQKVNIWKDFKYIILARGLGGILQWKISFSSRSLWKQLLTYCVDLGTLDGQRTSIKLSWFYFLNLVLLLLQLLHYFPP